MLSINAPGLTEGLAELRSSGAIDEADERRYLGNHKRLLQELASNATLDTGTWIAAVEQTIVTASTLDALLAQLADVKHGDRACITRVGGV